MKKEMTKPPGMERHGSCWRVTKRVPKSLLPHYHPHKFLRYPTGEPDEKAATVLAWRWIADLEEEFQRIRDTGSRFKQEISPEQIAALAGTHVAESLAVHEGVYIQGFLSENPSFKADFEEAARRRLVELREAGQAADFSLLGGYALGLLRRFKIPLSEEAPSFRVLCHALWKAEKEAYEGALKRHGGDWVETPPVPVPVAGASAPGVPRLSAVISAFLSKQDNEAPMFKKYQLTLRVFQEVLGDRPVNAIKQQEIDNFFSLLCKLPPRWTDEKRIRGLGVVELAALEWPKRIAPKTFEDSYLASMRPFLRDSRRLFGDQGFPLNLTTDGIKYSGKEKDGQNKQRALRPDELKRLYEGPELAAFAQDPQLHHCYWLPLVGLYTGARVNEVCQLNPQCDILEEGGIWFFNITEESETHEDVRKSIKNATSRRRVPIHSRLLELGILGYVQRMKGKGAPLLFPQWPPSGGKASGAAEKWFGRFLKKTGLRDETPGRRVAGFHIFRHTFLTRADQLDIPKAVYLTGHDDAEKSKVVKGYEEEVALPKQQDRMERMSFDLAIPAPVEA